MNSKQAHIYLIRAWEASAGVSQLCENFVKAHSYYPVEYRKQSLPSWKNISDLRYTIKYIVMYRAFPVNARFVTAKVRRTVQMQEYYMDLLVDALLDEGFTVKEASQLIALRERFEEEQQRARKLRETNHHRFIRWLVEQGRLSDW